MTPETLLPCPCCSNRTIAQRGAFEICPVCGWEDDPAQAADPDLVGGANRQSLAVARAAWRQAHPGAATSRD